MVQRAYFSDQLAPGMKVEKKRPNPMDGPSGIEIRGFHRVPYLPERESEYIAT